MSSVSKKRYIHEGWINKWTNFIGSWRPRYFMLEPGYLMYSTDKDGIVKESFLLSQCKIRLCPDDPVRLDIEVVGVGLLCLRTDTPLEKHKWYVSFKRAQKLLFQSYQRRVSNPSEVHPVKDTPALPDDISPNDAPVEESDSPQVNVTGLNDLTIEDKITDSVEEGKYDKFDSLSPDSPDFKNIFVKSKAGHEHKTALSFIMDNTVSLDKILNKLISELDEIVSPDSRNKLDLMRAVVHEFCSSIKLLYSEELHSVSELERSLFLVTKKNMELEERDITSGFDIPPRSPTNDTYSQRSVTSEPDYSFSADGEFYECEESRSSARSKDEKEDPPVVPNICNGADSACSLPKKHSIEPLNIKRRIKLPCPRTELKVNILSILKDLIGKDLSRISMPIVLNEPTSSLQRASEDFEYCHILTSAAKEADPVLRMALVTIFSITPYSSTVGRTYKPFNPLLGETFELTHRGFHFIAEQVAHHPPISAFHCFNKYFESYGSTNAVVNFTGKSIEVSILGPFLIDLKLDGNKESYNIQRGYILVHNIIFGKMWIEAVGTTIIRNVTSGEFSVVQYLKKGWFDKVIHEVRALVFNKYGKQRFYITGIWSKHLYMEEVITTKSSNKERILKDDGTLNFNESLYKNEDDAWDGFVNEIDWNNINVVPNSKKEVWKPNERPPESEKYYGFGYITMELNEITEDYDRSKGAMIPITDTRYRPDQRAYERGEIELASTEKRRLEDKQRRVAKDRADMGVIYKPMWFNKVIDPVTHQANWIFNGTYWDKKNNNTINEGVPDIFS